MKLKEIFLQEGITIHGPELFAYTVMIAEAFDALPVYDAAAVPAWESLIASNRVLAKRVLGKLDVEYTKDDPYKNFKELMNDVLVNKRLKVFKTPDDTHPGMSASDNDLFRAIHDALAHVGSNSQEFYAYLLKKDTDGSIGQYKPLWGGDFTVSGEMNAYLVHAKLAPKAAIPALFTEVIGQICYYFVKGDYAVNKVAIIEDVDYRNLGQCSGAAKARMQYIIEQMNDKDVTDIKTSLGDIKKTAIRWKLLSRGTGAGNIT